MSEKQNSLSDDEIRSVFKRYGKEYEGALDEAKALLTRLGDAKEPDTITVSAQSVRNISLALLGYQKALGEKVASPELRAVVGGDTGANCDYNPFSTRGVNF